MFGRTSDASTPQPVAVDLTAVAAPPFSLCPGRMPLALSSDGLVAVLAKDRVVCVPLPVPARRVNRNLLVTPDGALATTDPAILSGTYTYLLFALACPAHGGVPPEGIKQFRPLAKAPGALQFHRASIPGDRWLRVVDFNEFCSATVVQTLQRKVTGRFTWVQRAFNHACSGRQGRASLVPARPLAGVGP